MNEDGIDPPRFLKNGRYLWKSERAGGLAHLHVGSLSGGEPRPITRGSWMVDHVAGVDEAAGVVYFTATEENVRRRPMYRVSLDGNGFTRLTTGAGTHSAELSDDGRHLLDTFSNLQDPPALSLLDSSGRAVRTVVRPQNRLSEYELAQAEEVEVSADDGARLMALSFVDPARIGIWGWSYGGYMTLYSLTNAPDVWKCGVAGAPVTHWKFYDTIYTERYLKTPQENPKGYEASAPLTRAANLKAKLLLIHGMADDNVHLQNTVAFVDALTRAGRPYQLQIQPGQKHGFRGKTAVNFRNAASARFFEENL